MGFKILDFFSQTISLHFYHVLLPSTMNPALFAALRLSCGPAGGRCCGGMPAPRLCFQQSTVLLSNESFMVAPGNRVVLLDVILLSVSVIPLLPSKWCKHKILDSQRDGASWMLR